ncbi:MAG: 2-oxoacid:acceptor oxidoreductase family protein [Candidatus Omnitrophota bacterium]|nr:2-oxoacid:acceptor oxidoreductase family protein [Candidatus Omnitrophota bacterium]
MDQITEIRWHGRGGQGAKTAAQFLAEAALEDGKYIQAFPEYGPERAGAPINTYTRISSHPIRVHSGVKNPQAMVIIDPSLATPSVLEGLAKDGIVVINSPDTPQTLKEKLNYKNGKIAAVDATRISLDIVGISTPNTPMLGALLKVFPVLSVDMVIEKLKAKFLKKLGEKKTQANIEAVKKAYEEVKIG